MTKIVINSGEELRKEGLFPFLTGDKKGVIELAVPVANITQDWAKYSRALNLAPRQIEYILYYKMVVITDPKDADIGVGAIIPCEELDGMKKAGRSPEYAYGVEGLQFLANKADLDRKSKEAVTRDDVLMTRLEELERAEENAASDNEARAVREKIGYLENELADVNEVLRAIQYVKATKDTLATSRICVIPLEFRQFLEVAAQKIPYAIPDLEDLYYRVAIRNSRLKRLMEIDAPDIILRNERRVLQETVDTLIANGKRGEAVTVPRGNADVPLISLLDVVAQTVRFI